MAATAGRAAPGQQNGTSTAPLRPLVGRRLLAAWERGAAVDDPDRPLALLAAASPEAAPGEFARLDLRRRTRDLLRLRGLSFGDVLPAVVPCPSCRVSLEFSVLIPPVLEHLADLDRGESIEWTAGAARCVLRAATTDDLRRAAEEPTDEEARRRLLHLCLSAEGAGTALEALLVDPNVLDRFERLHEGAEITCDLRCPACGTTAAVDLDIARFLWDEVRHAALRLLRDVHDLAVAYGWAEADILTMSAERRGAYLGMVRA